MKYILISILVLSASSSLGQCRTTLIDRMGNMMDSTLHYYGKYYESGDSSYYRQSLKWFEAYNVLSHIKDQECCIMKGDTLVDKRIIQEEKHRIFLEL